MHAKSVRYFDAIARSGSICEAARKLHVDASAVNRQLLNLEDELGAVLFDRLPAGLRLTEAGALLLRHVVNVMQDEQRLLGELEQLRGVERGEVRIAAVEALNAEFLPTVIEQMARRYPNVRMHVNILGSTAIAGQIMSGEMDVGLAFALPLGDDLDAVCTGTFTLGAVMSRSHSLAMRAAVSVEECARFPLILPNRDMGLYTLLAPLLAAVVRDTSSVIRTSSIELMRQLAMRGLGIAFHTRIGLEALCEAERLAYIPLADTVQAALLGVHVRAGRVLPPALAAFTAIVRTELERLQMAST